MFQTEVNENGVNITTTNCEFVKSGSTWWADASEVDLATANTLDGVLRQHLAILTAAVNGQ